MATPTTFYALSKPLVDGDDDVWGDEGNANWDLLDAALAAIVGPGFTNGKMSVTAAAATGTFTADMVRTVTALRGVGYKLTAYSQAVNLATTGAGGMDTGTAPVSGFVSLYAINKADGTTSILACAVATSSAEVYGGANMPSGYIASALLAILPTNGSSQFPICFTSNRSVHFAAANVVSTTGDGAYHAIDISANVPSKAKTVSGGLTAQVASSSSGISASVASNVGGTLGVRVVSLGVVVTANHLIVAPYAGLPVITTQTIYYTSDSGTAVIVSVDGYTF